MNPQLLNETIGIIIVDHGSRRQASNDMLLGVVAMFEEHTDYEIVEPAHMEQAEPSIQVAFERCVNRGANIVVIHPYFLLPGRHWDEDIPALAAKAAEGHEDVRFLVTAPLGLHNLLATIMNERIQHCLAHAHGLADTCEVCEGTEKCRISGSTTDA